MGSIPLSEKKMLLKKMLNFDLQDNLDAQKDPKLIL